MPKSILKNSSTSDILSKIKKSVTFSDNISLKEFQRAPDEDKEIIKNPEPTPQPEDNIDTPAYDYKSLLLQMTVLKTQLNQIGKIHTEIMDIKKLKTNIKLPTLGFKISGAPTDDIEPLLSNAKLHSIELSACRIFNSTYLYINYNNELPENLNTFVLTLKNRQSENTPLSENHCAETAETFNKLR